MSFDHQARVVVRANWVVSPSLPFGIDVIAITVDPLDLWMVGKEVTYPRQRTRGQPVVRI